METAISITVEVLDQLSSAFDSWAEEDGFRKSSHSAPDALGAVSLLRQATGTTRTILNGTDLLSRQSWPGSIGAQQPR